MHDASLFFLFLFQFYNKLLQLARDQTWNGMEEVGKEREMEEAHHELVVIREGETEVVENPDDDDLAEAVQMQELLFFLLQPQPDQEVLELEAPQGVRLID